MKEIYIRKCMAEVKDGRSFVSFELERPEDVNDFVKYTKKCPENTVITIKKKITKSKSMNSYMWILCEKVAKELSETCQCVFTKTDIYKQAIREVGVFTDKALPDEEAENAIACWSKKGTGYFAEVIFYSMGKTHIRFYKGSSAYDGNQLKRLVDYVADMAEELSV